MARKICYGEICRNDEEINVRNLILIVLVVAVAITAVVMTRNLLNGSELLNFPFFPAE